MAQNDRSLAAHCGAEEDVHMSIAVELEQWLRDEAAQKLRYAESRKQGARLTANLSDEDVESARRTAEQMMGRKLPKQSKTQRQNNSRIEERIATKLQKEGEMLIRFADFVAQTESPAE
jgi:hypothetical protein